MAAPDSRGDEADEAAAYVFLEQLSWGDDGPSTCPHCGSGKGAWYLKPRDPAGRKSKGGSTARSNRRVWKCRESTCRRQFSVITNSAMHATKMPVHAWVGAIEALCTEPEGISAREIAQRWGIAEKSAWAMLERIRDAIGNPQAAAAAVVASAPVFFEHVVDKADSLDSAAAATTQADTVRKSYGWPSGEAQALSESTNPNPPMPHASLPQIAARSMPEPPIGDDRDMAAQTPVYGWADSANVVGLRDAVPTGQGDSDPAVIPSPDQRDFDASQSAEEVEDRDEEVAGDAGRAQQVKSDVARLLAEVFEQPLPEIEPEIAKPDQSVVTPPPSTAPLAENVAKPVSPVPSSAPLSSEQDASVRSVTAGSAPRDAADKGIAKPKPPAVPAAADSTDQVADEILDDRVVYGSGGAVVEVSNRGDGAPVDDAAKPSETTATFDRVAPAADEAVDNSRAERRAGESDEGDDDGGLATAASLPGLPGEGWLRDATEPQRHLVSPHQGRLVSGDGVEIAKPDDQAAQEHADVEPDSLGPSWTAGAHDADVHDNQMGLFSDGGGARGVDMASAARGEATMESDSGPRAIRPTSRTADHRGPGKRPKNRKKNKNNKKRKKGRKR